MDIEQFLNKQLKKHQQFLKNDNTGYSILRVNLITSFQIVYYRF